MLARAELGVALVSGGLHFLLCLSVGTAVARSGRGSESAADVSCIRRSIFTSLGGRQQVRRFLKTGGGIMLGGNVAEDVIQEVRRERQKRRAPGHVLRLQGSVPGSRVADGGEEEEPDGTERRET